MPKLTNETPKYRRHASGNARVRINGKDIYLGPYGTSESKREYNRIVGEWLANHRTLPLSARGSGYSMAELIAAYWRHAQEYYAVPEGKSNGELWSIKMALRMVKKLYLNAEVADFGPLAMRAVRDAMVKEDWSRTYCNVQVNRLRRMFKWGVEHELVPADKRQTGVAHQSYVRWWLCARFRRFARSGANRFESGARANTISQKRVLEASDQRARLPVSAF
jgi:hypothetical protein